MPIYSAVPDSFKREILDAVHDPDDDYKIALFESFADLGAETTSYSEQRGEVEGAGYTKGGVSLRQRTTGLSGSTAWMTFANPRWTAASFTAHGALIYNASKSNRAVAVINFGKDHTCTNGSFDMSLPPAGADAIVRVG